MITFEQYILEYAKKEHSMFSGVSKLKHGQNGKNFDSAATRVHANTVPKTYVHKHPLVSNVANGKANNVAVAGPQLQMILKLYDTDYEDNTTKTLGNSNVEIVISNGQAILRQKVENHDV